MSVCSSVKSLRMVDIEIKLSKFYGLQFEGDEVTEFEVIAIISNKIILKHDERIKSRGENSCAAFKHTISAENENDMFDLFLYPMTLKLIKFENGSSSEIGFCAVDMSQLFTSECKIIKGPKKFMLNPLSRKISFDIEIFTNRPLLEVDYENSLMFTIESINHVKDLKDFKIGVKIPCLREIDNNISYAVSLTSNEEVTCERNFKRWLGLFSLPKLASHSDYPITTDPTEDKETGGEPKRTIINGCFKSPIVTNEARDAFYDLLRGPNNLVIEVLINGTDHMFGMLNCEELLNVGQRKVKVVVPLYKFHLGLFSEYCNTESQFYVAARAKKRSTKKSTSFAIVPPPTLEESKAFDDCCNQISIVVELELEKPLNPEIAEENFEGEIELADLSSSVDAKTSELRKKLLIDVKSLIQTNKNLNLKEVVDVSGKNGQFDCIEHSILSKVEEFRILMPESDNDKFLCQLTSNIVNPKKGIKSNSLLSKVYYALNDIEKCEDMLMKDIVNNPDPLLPWIDLAIFNLKLEAYNMSGVIVKELLQRHPESFIGRVMDAYLIYKTQKFSNCRQALDSIISDFDTEELSIFKYFVDLQLGNETFAPSQGSICHQATNYVDKNLDLAWNVSGDQSIVNQSNIFIRTATFFIKIGCFDIAELCLGEYYQSFGSNINYLYLLAAIDSSKRKYDKALLHFNKIAEKDIGNNQVNFLKIAPSIILCHLHMKNFSEAEKMFTTYMQIDTCDNFFLLLLFGIHFNSIRKWSLSREFLSKAIQISNCHLVYRELGKTLFNLGLYKIAEIPLVAAIEHDENDVETWKSLKEIYNFQRRHDAAKFCESFIE